jgi:DNA-binding NarL/FixJ family response regulator
LYGRILAVANTYARLVQQQGDQQDPAEALRKMHSLVGRQFDRACYDALVTSVKSAEVLGKAPRRPREVGNLTGREAEVLCLLAQGHNTPQIARTLGMSKKTVEHHVAHIYDKLGVRCRTAAVAYTVQQGLV